MSAPEKIHHPETGIYIGLVWSRGKGNDERWYAEDQNGDTFRYFFDSRDEAERWLKDRVRKAAA